MRKNILIRTFNLFISIALSHNLVAQGDYNCVPVSGADGLFETITYQGQTVYRTLDRDDGYQYYMYFKCPETVSKQTVYLEVDYFDLGYGSIGLEYNSTSSDYKICRNKFQNFVLGNGQIRSAIFRLDDANFTGSQNLEADFRLNNDGSLQMYIISATIYTKPTDLYLELNENFLKPYTGPIYSGNNLVSNNSLVGKVICGYQGWFRAPGDLSGDGWVHYANGDFSDVNIEMWPDMLEFSADEKYPVPGWTHSDGRQAYLFSSANKKSIIRHFQWMEAYGIDGIGLERFVVSLEDPPSHETFRIPSYCREAANLTGRTFYVMYDLSKAGSTAESISKITVDWQYMVDSMKITEDSRYQFQNGKPVVGLFGFYSERFSASEANNILDIFQNDGPYGAYVMGSGDWLWPSEYDTDWYDVFLRMDAWMPWNVGNFSGDTARTDMWESDKSTLEAAGVMFIPCIYPSTCADNGFNYPPGTTYKSRLSGQFMWKQFLEAKRLDVQSIYIAMFDEIDEATSIFKVTNDFPTNNYFVGLEGLPSDFYLLQTGYATKMMRDEVEVPANMPDFEIQSQPSIPEITSVTNWDIVEPDVVLNWTAAKHVSGILDYEVEIDQTISQHVDTFLSVHLPDGLHHARVRAFNTLNNKSGWSLPVFFITNKNAAYLSNPDTAFVTIYDTIQIYEHISVTDTLIINVVLTGISPPDNINVLRVYPNPTRDHIFINTGRYVQMDGYILKIIDSQGKIVYETNIEDQLYQLNLSDFSGKGLYFFQISDTGGQIVSTKKIILQ